MEKKVIIMLVAFISLLTNCQKESVNPSIEGTYVVNDYKALERYGDLSLCIVCGPRDISPLKITLIKLNGVYNLEINGLKRPNPFDASKREIDREEYSHLFKDITVKTEGGLTKILFKEQLIGSVENNILKISNLIFEVTGKSIPMLDTNYSSISASR